MLQDGLAAIRKAGFNVGAYAALKDSPKTCAELKVIGRVLLDVVYSGKQRALPKPWLTASPLKPPDLAMLPLSRWSRKFLLVLTLLFYYVRSKKRDERKKKLP